jgi:KGK domain
MNNQNKQIIPELQSVVNCLDGTSLLSDLLKELKPPVDNQLKILHRELKAENNVYLYRDRMEAFINRKIPIESKEMTITELLEDGLDCNLLQPDGKGWQKGKLTMCFQFTPEENEFISTQEISAEVNNSPLDEIRQLANSLPIDQN